MRFTASIGALIILGFSALAQELPLPNPETQDAVPGTTSVLTSSPSPAPELIPADVLPAIDRGASPAPPSANEPAIPKLDEIFRQNPLSAAAENSRRHAEWRQLQNRVVNDAKVKEALRLADAAGTDLEKRKLLRSYYQIFFGKMIALASTPEMKAYLNERKKNQLNALPQPRVRPEPAAPAKPNS